MRRQLQVRLVLGLKVMRLPMFRFPAAKFRRRHGAVVLQIAEARSVVPPVAVIDFRAGDEDIRQQTEILGDAFDEVVLYQDQCQRGRADGEVLGLLRQGLENAKRTRDVKEIRGEFVAIDTAFASLKAGELCLILVDQVEEALGYITQRVVAG